MNTPHSYRLLLASVSGLVLLSAVGCKHTSAPDDIPAVFPEGADTVYTQKAAMDAMAYDGERALTIIDSARLVGNLSDFWADLLRMKVYSQSLEGQRLDSTMAIGRRLLEDETLTLNADNRLDVLDMLVNAARQIPDDEQLILWTQQKADVCRELGDETEALRTEAERGVVLARLGHTDEGLKLLEGIIDRLDGIRRFNEMDTWIVAVRRKISILESLPGSSGQIVTLSLRILSRLEDYARNPDIYQDGSFREPDDADKPAYIEFYQSKCYAKLAGAYAGTDPAEAKRYLAKYEQTDNGRSFTGRVMIAPILCRLGEFEKMEAIYQEMDARTEPSDTLTDTYLTMLHDRAVAAETLGRTDDALTLWKRYDALKGIIADRTMTGKTHLYSVRYQTEEQQRALEQEQARRKRLVAFNIILGILVLLIFLYLVFTRIRHGKKTPEPNQQGGDHPAGTVPAPAKQPADMNDEELFQYLSEVIRREQLYLNPLLDRQTLIKRFGVSAHRIGAAFSKGSKYQSLPGFIRSLRLEHACSLLVSHPEMSVKAIGEASGFSNKSTFCSDFKSFYGVTPSGYRQAKPPQKG